MKRLIYLIIITAIVFAGYKYKAEIKDFISKLDWLPSSKQEMVLDSGDQKIKLNVEVADTVKKRERGLMDRKELKEGAGMWFVFEDEAPRTFWMRNTLIPLDMLFFNDKKEVVAIIENMEPCAVPQCPAYASGVSAKYALEVRDGFVKAYGIEAGDRVN